MNLDNEKRSGFNFQKMPLDRDTWKCFFLVTCGTSNVSSSESY